METNRLLIDYLPPFMQDYRQMKEITNVEQPEIDGLWNACENAMFDQFLMDATENGVRRWERLVGITPRDTDTLDERKFRVFAMMNQRLPYTMNKLKETLTTICGEGNFFIVLTPNDYHVEVKLALTNVNNYQEVVDIISNMIPANMTKAVSIMYNDHTVLGQFTHAQLSAYTHAQLRNNVLV